MKRLFLLIFATLTITNSTLLAKDIYVSTSFHEPATEGLRFIYSRDGIRWDSIQGVFLRPKVGQQKVMRDPSIVKGPDGTFHLVWTSSWRGDLGFGYSSSKDLIHWTPQRFIETGMDTTTVNTWAPELFYDDVKRQYLIVWASCVPGRFPDGQEEHKNNHRLYYMTTKDFRTFSKTQLFYEPGFSAIDATLVKRGNQDYVMVVKDNTRPMRNIKVAFATSPYGPWSAASEPFTESFTEGPSTAKVGDWYYIYYDSYRHKIYGAHRTKDFKTFQDQTGSVRFPIGHKHGTVFMADEQLVENLKKYNRDCVRYTGTAISRPERHDGGLQPTIGVHNIQTLRGEKPWTYNHQPMMAYWNGRFYMHYLTDPRHEHEAPGKTMLQTSEDGYTWSAPVELFPEYNVPEGFCKEGSTLPPAHNLKAVMHQRVGWYVAPNGKLLAIGYYGICQTMKDDPNDGNGIGRVVREIKKDGTFGPIYFIHYNHGFSEKNTDYPYYKKAKDKNLVKAVDALIADPMQRMQWAEESDRGDDILPFKSPLKAFSGYTLPDGRKVGLWKHALTSISADGGNTWREPAYRAPGLVNSNAKIWGQRLSDGSYATVYNPAEYRWPLAISLSSDGLNYNTLSLVHGDVMPLRHGGQFKSYGPQYVRGIQEGNGTPKDGNLWVTYSTNKEDIWVSRIPVPVRLNATTHAGGEFKNNETVSESNNWTFNLGSVSSLTNWNLYIPSLCRIFLKNGWLNLYDCDPYDYAKAERVIPATKELEVEFDLMMDQVDKGEFDIEFMDNGGNVCSRIVVDSAGAVRVKGGARYGTLVKKYEMGVEYHIKALLSTSQHRAVYFVDGKKVSERQFDTPVEAITRIVFRTGKIFTEPNNETPADQDFDMPRADELDPAVGYHIANVVSRPMADGVFPLHGSDAPVVASHGGSLFMNQYNCLDARAASQMQPAVLSTDILPAYADRFAADEKAFYALDTEERKAPQPDITNEDAANWMAENIPLFDCPDKDFNDIYYFRWWSLRKHIKRTPVGWGMTEFLVPRSYADRYNLIACAIGHHVMETRWLRDTTYMHQILRTWYYGNDGQAMQRMNKFSSWNPHAIYEAFKVQGDTTFLLALRPRLEEEYARWKSTNRLENGLYWQGDVQDGMEESISGGRKKQYARPTINSYMAANAKALGQISLMENQQQKATEYDNDYRQQLRLIEEKLWNNDHQFFETMRGDTSAQVREAIGYMPWYCNLFEGQEGKSKYDVAWKQLTDEKGFSAPYGLTTAERRHPLFRSHGFGKCEWDGAIWPFATSQTLTALANYLNDGTNVSGIDSSVFFKQMNLYAQSQHMRGKPYIGEYLDETTGYWLMGDRERSRYYNHSTFADLVITGLAGLRPQADGSIVVNPLIPADSWDYFCLDGILYRGQLLTIIWDRDGQHYHQGQGLTLMVNGKTVANRKDIGRIEFK